MGIVAPADGDRVLFWLRVSAVATFMCVFALVGVNALVDQPVWFPEPIWTVAMLPPLIAMRLRWQPETRHIDHTFTVLAAATLYGMTSLAFGFWVALVINIATVVLALVAPRRQRA